MHTLYSLTLLREDGGTTIVDYLDELGWRRHEFDRLGGYEELSPCTAAALDALHEETATALVHELRQAAEALTEALAPDLPDTHAPDPPSSTSDPPGAHVPDPPIRTAPLAMPWAGRVRRDRRDLLQRLAHACSQGLGDAINRLSRAPAGDDAAIARAARAAAFMRAARELAVRALAEDGHVGR